MPRSSSASPSSSIPSRRLRRSAFARHAVSLASAALLLVSIPCGSIAGKAGTFEIINHNSQASAMMLGFVNQDTVLILDKTENNRDKLNDGRPIWGSFLDLNTNQVRGVPVNSNTFCAAGATMGNGTWLVAGGNQAVGYGGVGFGNNQSQTPYKDWDGRQAIRLLEPVTNNANLQWIDGPVTATSTPAQVNMMQSPRWYPGIEVLEDGSVLLIGGSVSGGYINRNTPNIDPFYEGGSLQHINWGGANPTYKYFPSKGGLQVSQFMGRTSGLNLYPHTYLMPSGKIFMQANSSTTLWDHEANVEDLPPMPGSVIRVYPASAAVAMMPLTPDNNYTPTILFCGGSVMSDQLWGNYTSPGDNILGVEASKDCSSITPELNDGTKNPDAAYSHHEDLPEGRSMGQFVHLPDGTMVIVNGCAKGTAGYTNATWNYLNAGTPNEVRTEGLGQDPTYTPVLYDPSKPVGSRLTQKGFKSSTIARLYHSTAILIPDGSVLIAGSNPHQDVSLNMPVGTSPQAFNTTYEIEKWYPPYYDQPRPNPQGMPDSIQYGGSPFNITVDGTYMGDSANKKAADTKFVIIRPGFSTHAMNMGQRAVYLNYTYTVNDDASVTYMINPLPASKAMNRLLVPGPALFFVTVAGVPSQGQHMMVGTTSSGGPAVPFAPAFGAALQQLPAPVNNSKYSASVKSYHSNGHSSFGLGKIIGIAAGGAAALILAAIGFFCWRRHRNKAKDMAGSDGAAWGGRDIGGSGAEYKRVETPAGSINGNFAAARADSQTTFESYHMNNVEGSESKEALSQYYDQPGQASRGGNSSFQPSPLAAQSNGGSYQQHGWGEYHAGDAGAYYEDNTDRYGQFDAASQRYYDNPPYASTGSGYQDPNSSHVTRR